MPVDSGNYRPQMYGPGTESRFAWGGASDPVILVVTSRADAGPGTLRAALEDSRPRVIVFWISGYIILTSDLIISNPYFVVAGQTAPSPGITIRYQGSVATQEVMIIVDTHDGLFQHFRIRPGDTTCNSGVQVYHQTTSNLHHIVFDHVSESWATDEGLNFGYEAHDCSFWRSFVAENLSFTPGTAPCGGGGYSGGHGMGVGFGDNIGAIGNILAHNRERNLLTSGSHGDYYANNLIYNPGAGPEWLTGYAGFYQFSAIGVSNYFKRGSTDEGTVLAFGSRNASAGSQLYLGTDNLLDNGPVGQPFTLFQVIGGDGIDPRVGSPPFAAPAGFTPRSGAATYAFNLANGGARPLDRDAVDLRIIGEIQTRTGILAPQTVAQVGGYPALAENAREFVPVANFNDVAAGQDFRTNGEMQLEAFCAIVEPADDGSTPPPPPPPPPPPIIVIDPGGGETGGGDTGGGGGDPTVSDGYEHLESPQLWWPASGLGVSVTVKASYGDGPWAELTPSASADAVLTGLTSSFVVSEGADLEFQIGVGASGSEVVTATIPAAQATMDGSGPGYVRLQVPIACISAGDRVSVRARKNTATDRTHVVQVGYVNTPLVGLITTTTQPMKALRPVSVTPNASSYGWSAWVELAASVTTAILVHHLTARHGGLSTEQPDFEVQIGTGASGSESGKDLLRGGYNNTASAMEGFPFILGSPFLFDGIPAGSRVAIRLRKRGTDVTAWRIGLAYYEKPL